MVIAVLLLAAMYMAFAVILLVKPQLAIGWIQKLLLLRSFQIGVVVASVLYTLLFYFAAEQSNYSDLFGFIALMSLCGGVVCAVLPHKDLIGLVEWELKLMPRYKFLFSFLMAGFAGFLVFSVL